MDFAPYMALLWTGLHLKCRDLANCVSSYALAAIWK